MSPFSAYRSNWKYFQRVAVQYKRRKTSKLFFELERQGTFAANKVVATWVMVCGLLILMIVLIWPWSDLWALIYICICICICMYLYLYGLNMYVFEEHSWVHLHIKHLWALIYHPIFFVTLGTSLVRPSFDVAFHHYFEAKHFILFPILI